MERLSKQRRVRFAVVMVLGLLVFPEFAAQVTFLLKYRQTPRRFGDQAFQQARLYMDDHPYLPYRATQGRTFVNRKTWGDSAPVEFNSWGDRSAEPDVPKRRVRLIAFGGSTTFGARSRPEETWPAQLEAQLGPERFEVINAGNNGATTADTLVTLALIHLDLQPDWILVYHGSNDLESSYATGFKSDYSHRRRKIAVQSPVFESLPRWLDHSALFVLIRTAILGNRSRANLWSRYTRPSRYDFERGPAGLETFRRNLRSIVALARENGAKVVLGTFQYRKDWAEEHASAEFAEAWEKGLLAQNQVIRELGRTDADVFIAEVAGSFEPSAQYMWDFCHLTPAGNVRVAEAFREALVEAGVPADDPRRIPDAP